MHVIISQFLKVRNSGGNSLGGSGSGSLLRLCPAVGTESPISQGSAGAREFASKLIDVIVDSGLKVLATGTAPRGARDVILPNPTDGESPR